MTVTNRIFAPDRVAHRCEDPARLVSPSGVAGASGQVTPGGLGTVGSSSCSHSSHDPSYTATSTNPAALSAKYEPAAATPLPHETIVRFPRSRRRSETR